MGLGSKPIKVGQLLLKKCVWINLSGLHGEPEKQSWERRWRGVSSRGWHEQLGRSERLARPAQLWRQWLAGSSWGSARTAWTAGSARGRVLARSLQSRGRGLRGAPGSRHLPGPGLQRLPPVLPAVRSVRWHQGHRDTHNLISDNSSSSTRQPGPPGKLPSSSTASLRLAEEISSCLSGTPTSIQGWDPAVSRNDVVLVSGWVGERWEGTMTSLKLKFAPDDILSSHQLSVKVVAL